MANNSLSQIPIYSTQQKYKEAEYFFMKMIENYHNPWEFQFNINAFIQALRNITFMLQSEEIKPSNFEDWYKHKQEEMRANSLLRKFVEARNIIVKQSVLTSRSKAKVGLYRGRQMKFDIAHDIPPFTDTRVVLKNAQELAIGFFIDEEHSEIDEQLGVERIWVVEELGEQEVTSLCLDALNYMGQLVSEALQLCGHDSIHEDIRLNLSAVQVVLETDIDPSLIKKWGW